MSLSDAVFVSGVPSGAGQELSAERRELTQAAYNRREFTQDEIDLVLGRVA